MEIDNAINPSRALMGERPNMRWRTPHTTTLAHKALLTALLAGTFALTLSALFAEEAAAQKRPLLIVPFDNEQVDPALYQRFMDQIRADAEGSSDYKPLPPIEQNLTDLLFTVGCADPEPNCLQLIGQEFGADAIIYGSVWFDGRQKTLQTVNLFDVLAGVSVLDVPIERTFESEDSERVLNMLVAEVQQIFYPFTGQITITTSEPAAEILFDGVPVGNTLQGPLKLENRALGEHIITVRNEIGIEWDQSAVLMYDKTTETFVDMIIPETPGYAHTGSVISFSVGGLSILAGGVFSFLTASASSDATDLGNTDANPKINTNEANNILSSGPSFETYQWILYGVGVAGLATGAVLYFFVEDDTPEVDADGNVIGTTSKTSPFPIIAPIVTEDTVGAGALFTF